MSPPAPHRVLMTADTIGGVWTFAIELCAFLCRHGTDVTLVSMGRLPDMKQRRQASAIAGLTLVETGFRLEWMEDCEADLAESGALMLALAREIRPDLVHANTFFHAALRFDAPVLLTAHSCVASWWRACNQTALPPSWACYANRVARAVECSDMLVAPTQSFLSEFQSLHGRARNARVIWNGRESGSFHPAKKEPFALAAGRLWDEAKNIRTLLRAAGESELPLVVAGDDESPDGSRAEIRGASFLGRLCEDELAHWMSRAAVFAAPAWYEPFGLSILEAALSGCALVLADIPTLRELWDGAASFVDPDDAAAWASVLAAHLAEPDRALRAGQAARARAARYSAKRMGDAYREAYRALVSTNLSGVAA